MVMTDDDGTGTTLLASVVIPVYNGERGIATQLAALGRQGEALRLEVIVADNGSTDRTADVARTFSTAFGALRVVDAGARPGVNHARNAGLVAATCDRVLICDHDDEVRDGWVGALLARLETADVVGGRVVPRARDATALGGWGAGEDLLRTVFGYLPYAVGSCLGVRRDAALAIGGFDETFLRGHDEVDFCWRLQQAGFTLAGAPDAIVDYWQRDRAVAAARQSFHSARTQILLWVRHHERGTLSSVSFRASVRNLVFSARELPRLLHTATRFAAARTLGWTAGTVVGHLRYRIAGTAPDPALLPVARGIRGSDVEATFAGPPRPAWYRALQQLKHRGFLVRKRARQMRRAATIAVTAGLLRARGRFVGYTFDPARYPGEFVTLNAPAVGRHPSPVPLRITTFWLGGATLSANRQRGIDSIREFNPGVDVRLFGDDDIAAIVVAGHPFHPAYRHLALTHRSDYLRCYVMHFYGGGYTDIKPIHRSWSPALRRLDAIPYAWALGFRELTHVSPTDLPGRIQDDVRRNFFRIIGNGAFIMRPGTPLTREWFDELHRRMDLYAADLARHPGGIRGGEEGGAYPVPKHALLGDILGPLALKYHEHLIIDESIRPDFEGYL